MYTVDELRNLPVFDGLEISVLKERFGKVVEFFVYNNNRMICHYEYQETFKFYSNSGILL